MEYNKNSTEVFKNEPLNDPTEKSKNFSSLAVIFIIVSIYFLGYLYTYKAETPNAFVLNANEEGYEDYSVSNAIGNGQKEAISSLVVLMLFCIILCIKERGGKYLLIRSVIITIIVILLILIIYINPLRLDVENHEKYSEAHQGLAATAFLLNSVYIWLTYIILKNKYQNDVKWYKSFLYYLAILNFFFFIFCISCALAGEKDSKLGKWRASGNLSYAFAAFENLQIASIITVTLFLGFNKNKNFKEKL